MTIQNATQLQAELEKIIEKVFETVSVKISEKLKAQIYKDTFTTPNQWYERTGQFENMWKWGDVKKSIGVITRELYPDTSTLQYDPDKWQHGNPGRSAAENLADILNLAFNNYREGYTSNLMFGGKHFSHFRRPYWENLIEKLFDQGELDRMFTEEFAKYGVVKF